VLLQPRLAVCALVVHAGLFLAPTNRPSTIQLASLTVPADRLPVGCTLRASDAVEARASTNPWTGTDPLVIATIRERMGHVTLVPDAPRSRHEAAMFRLQLANGVAEAYAAHYRGTSAEFVTVYAVTFDEPDNSRATETSQTELTGGMRFMAGSSEIVVGGKGSPCYEAVVRHIRAITAP
jgi:hypothetical protein